MEKMKLNIQLFNDGEIVIGTSIDTKSFSAQINVLEHKLEELEETYKLAMKDPDFGDEKLRELEEEIEKTINKLQEMKRKQEEIGQDESLEKEKGDLGDIIKKVGKWTLAIFGVRSAYNFIRQSVSTLSQYNKNLAKDIENIRYGLASALAPLIQRIIQWAYTLMQAVNYIWNKLFHHDLFSNMKKSLSSSTKSAQKLQKTIAGFDEMNIVGSTSNGGGGGVDVGKITESLTGTNLLSEKLKGILDEIANVLTILWQNVLQPMWENVLKPIGEWLLEKPERILAFIGAILGFKLIAGVVGLTGALSPLGVAIITIAGIIASQLIPEIVDLKNKQKDLEGVMKGNTEIREENTKSFVENSKKVGQNNKQVQANAKVLLRQVESARKVIDETRNSAKITDLFTGNIKTQNLKLKENYDIIYKDIKALGDLGKEHLLTDEEAQEYLKSLDKEIWYLADLRNKCEEGSEAYNKYQKSIDELNSLYFEVQKTYDKNIKIYWEEIAVLEEKNKTLNANSKEYKQNQLRIEELRQEIERVKGTHTAKVETKADEQSFKNVQDKIDNVTKTKKVNISADMNDANKVIKKFLEKIGLGLFTKLFPNLNYASILRKFSYHAKGGIINQPGRGVPIDMGGEAGREGVIPLTDSQQMELLGEAIGRYITINASITNTMNGRIISRELQKIQNENNFAGNR